MYMRIKFQAFGFSMRQILIRYGFDEVTIFWLFITSRLNVNVTFWTNTCTYVLFMRNKFQTYVFMIVNVIFWKNTCKFTFTFTYRKTLPFRLVSRPSWPWLAFFVGRGWHCSCSSAGRRFQHSGTNVSWRCTGSQWWAAASTSCQSGQVIKLNPKGSIIWAEGSRFG